MFGLALLFIICAYTWLHGDDSGKWVVIIGSAFLLLIYILGTVENPFVY